MKHAPTFHKLWTFYSVTTEVAAAYLVCSNHLHQSSTQELLGCKSSCSWACCMLLSLCKSALKGDNLCFHAAPICHSTP